MTCIDEVKTLKREVRALRKHLRDLISSVGVCVRCLDDEMKKPPTAERGGRIAKITNALEMQNDIAAHFGLGLPLQKK